MRERWRHEIRNERGSQAATEDGVRLKRIAKHWLDAPSCIQDLWWHMGAELSRRRCYVDNMGPSTSGGVLRLDSVELKACCSQASVSLFVWSKQTRWCVHDVWSKHSSSVSSRKRLETGQTVELQCREVRQQVSDTVHVLEKVIPSARPMNISPGSVRFIDDDWTGRWIKLHGSEQPRAELRSSDNKSLDVKTSHGPSGIFENFWRDGTARIFNDTVCKTPESLTDVLQQNCSSLHFQFPKTNVHLSNVGRV